MALSGTVYLPGCTAALARAVVDVWQTDAAGDYDHSDDFHYRGRTTTDEMGRYSFETVVPAAYRPRPAHIHVKVSHEDWGTLTTQMYFDSQDPRVSDAQLVSVAGPEAGGERRIGTFDFVLEDRR